MTTTTRNRRPLPRHPHQDPRWSIERWHAGRIKPDHVLTFCGEPVSFHPDATSAAHARWHAVETHRAAITGRAPATCPTCTARQD